MNRETQRYLQDATRGLWGKRKKAVQAELLGHIEARTQEFQLSGTAVDEALRQTLAEPGAPTVIRNGLLPLYTAPLALQAALLTLFTGTLLGTHSFSQAQVSLSTVICQLPLVYGASPEVILTYRQRDDLRRCPHTLALNLPMPRTAVERAGGRLTTQGDRLLVTLAPGQPALQVPWSTPDPLAQVPSAAQVPLDAFLRAASDAGLAVRLRGWENAELQVGPLTFRLQEDAASWSARDVYLDYLARALLLEEKPVQVGSLNLGLADGGATQFPAQQWRVTAEAGTVVALLSLDGYGNYDVDLAPVDAGGRVTLKARSTRLHFVADPWALTEAAPGEHRAVLLAFTGDLRVSTTQNPTAHASTTFRVLLPDRRSS